MSNILDRKIHIFLCRKICKSTIIYYWGQKGKLTGTRYVNNKIIMPIIEFQDRTRLWIFSNEMNNYIIDK